MTAPDLEPGAAGGLRDVAPGVPPPAVDPAVALVSVLDGPTSKQELLDQIALDLQLPSWFGRNWDALEELLRRRDPADDRAIVLVWHHPDRLPAPDRATAAEIFSDVARHRQGAHERPLIVFVDTPEPGTKEPAMADRTQAVPAALQGIAKVHHVALIVRSIDEALGLWRDQLGLGLETVMDIPQDRVRIAFLGVGESKVELVEPTDETTGVARFLASKGEGFHHVCFEVPDLAAALDALAADGLELIDAVPRRGAEGPVAFVHPRSGRGVLIELIEAPGGPAWTALGF